jgi:hypothetical protein
MMGRRRYRVNRRLFWISWPIITLLSAVPFLYVGYGLGFIHLPPTTWRDWCFVFWFFAQGAVMAQIWALPLALLLSWMWTPPFREPGSAEGSPRNCSGCGYDLTGNVSGRCPECGAAILATEARPAPVGVKRAKADPAFYWWSVVLAGIVVFWCFWFWR